MSIYDEEAKIGRSTQCYNRLAYDAQGNLQGCSFFLDVSYEEKIEKVAHQCRSQVSASPMPSVFYFLLYGIHKEANHPLFEESCLHPVDATELLKLIPESSIPLEPVHHKACLGFLGDLQALGLADSEIKQFVRLICGILAV
ncbi:hypothetical protein IE077_003856, partial [Cardiosporidium cionae]